MSGHKSLHVDVEERHQVTDLDGVLVATEALPHVRSVSLGVWIGVGSRDEQPGHAGYAHLLEHMLFKGNERWGAEAISQWFDRIGSDANAATTKEYTVLYGRVLDRHVGAALDIFGEMALAPALAGDDLESERQVILEEIAMYEDSPSEIAHELADRLVFGDHPLGAPIIGTSASIQGATAADLTAFHTAAYGKSRLVVTAAGRVDHDAFVADVGERLLGGVSGSRRGLAATDSSTVLRTREPASGAIERVARVVQKDTEQVHICLAGPGMRRMDERRHAALILDTILGGTSSSRLFAEVRERRGLAYSVYTYLGRFADAGIAGVNVAVRPDRVRTTLHVITSELQRMIEHGPTAEEMDRAREHVEGRTVLSLESSAARGNRLGGSLVAGIPIQPLNEVLDRIMAVSAEEVRELAAQLFDPARLSCAVVADDTTQAAADVEAELGLGVLASPPPTAVAG